MLSRPKDCCPGAALDEGGDRPDHAARRCGRGRRRRRPLEHDLLAAVTPQVRGGHERAACGSGRRRRRSSAACPGVPVQIPAPQVTTGTLRKTMLERSWTVGGAPRVEAQRGDAAAGGGRRPAASAIVHAITSVVRCHRRLPSRFPAASSVRFGAKVARVWTRPVSIGRAPARARSGCGGSTRPLHVLAATAASRPVPLKLPLVDGRRAGAQGRDRPLSWSACRSGPGGGAREAPGEEGLHAGRSWPSAGCRSGSRCRCRAPAARARSPGRRRRGPRAGRRARRAAARPTAPHCRTWGLLSARLHVPSSSLLRRRTLSVRSATVGGGARPPK